MLLKVEVEINKQMNGIWLFIGDSFVKKYSEGQQLAQDLVLVAFIVRCVCVTFALNLCLLNHLFAIVSSFIYHCSG